jgi:hypothetical protein
MAEILVDWGNQEETFLVVTIDGKWTVRDLADFMSEIIQLARSKPHDVQVIVDLQRSGRTPKGIIAASQSILSDMPDNLTKIILLSRRSVWRSVWYAVKGMYRHSPVEFHFVKTVEEAYALIPGQENPPPEPDKNDDSMPTV